MSKSGEYHKSFGSFQEALDYLKQFPYGTIEHTDMDLNSFLYLKNDGRVAFMNADYSQKCKITNDPKLIDEVLSAEDVKGFENPGDWKQTGFVYIPAQEFACLKDGLAWFADLQADVTVEEPSGPAL